MLEQVQDSMEAGFSLDLHITAEMDFKTKFSEHCGFDAAGAVRLFLVGRIDDLDVVRFVPGHHLVTRNSFKTRVHDRPLRGGFLPAPLGLLAGQLHDFAHS